jgi:hypothetical protein
MTTPDALSAVGGAGASPQAQGLTVNLGPDFTVETAAMPFAESQKPPTPPADTTRANAALAAAFRDGDPNGDNLPRADGAPTRD